MKNTLLYFFLFSLSAISSQEKKPKTVKSTYFQLDYFYGNILSQDGVKHLISGHPKGLLLSWNKRTFGEQLWEQNFNYPDVGFSFGYQDFENKYLGKLYALYTHYNFYFLKRNLIFSTGTGVAYSTNPYDKITNNKNVSLATHINSTSFFKLLYQREHLFQNIGVQAGFTFIHASNASIKAPNRGINTWGVNLGLNYDLNNKPQKFIRKIDTVNYREPIRFNASFLTGVNESDHIGTGIKPFIILSFFADKRLNRKNAIQFGTELNLHYYLKDYIKFQYVFNGDVERTNFPDWKRIGLFVGHELFINKTSFITQLGYYVYSPAILNEGIYERIGFKRYFNNPSYYASITLKAHFVNAESLEFGIGYRF
ncbi:MAG: Uncharacterised protein [Polaribacter sejongensis]|nr:MAG: Uncharacterised protein [Polaribacter sejongensis]